MHAYYKDTEENFKAPIENINNEGQIHEVTHHLKSRKNVYIWFLSERLWNSGEQDFLEMKI